MRVILFLLAILGAVTAYYVAIPLIKSTLYLIKLRRTDGVGDFVVNFEGYILTSSFMFMGHAIDVKTKLETTNSFHDALHTLWDYYDCMKTTFDETIRIAKVNPELEKAHYIYSNNGGLIHEY